MNNQENFKKLGMQGEAIAAKFLMRRGYSLIEHNVHAQGGEIDLLMMNSDKEWVVVEVKTRKSDAFGSGKSAITKSKFKKMLSATRDFFLKQKNFSEVPFFRVEAVILRIDDGKIFCEHIENIGHDSF
jgi:putative endonuclease